jgi:MFS transporter, BCD family, chlorophyll transporter
MSARPPLLQGWMRLAPRFLPFADAASVELPLPRLVRLSLFQVSVGMVLTLLVGTLNRVMIVELGVSAALVGAMIALPLAFAPLRALVGFRSDHHRSALGWRRVPYLWFGTLLQFGGLAIMPFALIVLSGDTHGPLWYGQVGAALGFLLVGAGLHTTQTVGLALATDLAPDASRPRVVALMCTLLLVGAAVSSLAYGALLAEFSQMRLIQVIQGTAVLCLVLNIAALWKQEPRGAAAAPRAAEPARFADAWRLACREPHAVRRLVALALGTLAFGMQDVLLEPYGGQVLGMGVGATTWLTATLAAGGLIGFSLASAVLSRGADPVRMAMGGAALGVPAFAAVIAAPSLSSLALFVAGVFAIGLGGGLFSHGTLTLTMNRAPKDQAGLALGVWGAVQATAAGVGVALGGIGRDTVQAVAVSGAFGERLTAPATGYAFVYGLEIVLLVATLMAMAALLRQEAKARQKTHRSNPPHPSQQQWSAS